MTGAALALVLGAAILHSAWNALAKRAHDPLTFLWCSVTLATGQLGPVALWVLGSQGFPLSALPFVVATTVLHALYFFALGRSYQLGELSLVYPVARGLGVALVPLLALFLFDERLSPLGTAGIALVVSGIVGLHLTPRAWSAEASGSGLVGPGTGWALLTGLTIAAYSLVDKAGVARLHPVPYLGLLGFGSIVLLSPAVLSKPAVLRREWAVNWRAILLASAMNLTAYLLVLFAFRLSKVGYVVAARELSIVLSAIIGSVWLNEGRLGPRLTGAGVVLLGVACVALAR
jgi:drug/metabolite transporter (DMT)-like permease